MALIYSLLFKSCTITRKLNQVHAHLLVTGHHRDATAATKLIEMYSRSSDISAARAVFNGFTSPDSFMWVVMIRSCVWNDLFGEAIVLYMEMQSCRIPLNIFVFPPVLKAFSGLRDGRAGKKVHGGIIKLGFDSHAALSTAILGMYEFESYADALKVFNEMLIRDAIAWSSMLSCCIRCEKAIVGLTLLSCLINWDDIELDHVMVRLVAEACCDIKSLKRLKSVHGLIIRRFYEVDELTESSLINFYAKCDDLVSSIKIFRRAGRKRSVIYWTAIIFCYIQRSYFREVLILFIQMCDVGVEPSSDTLVSVLFSCAQLGFFAEGRSVHGFLVRRGLQFVKCSITPMLINMYAHFGRLGDCESVFVLEQQKTLAVRSSIITIFTQNEFYEKALDHFVSMRKEGLFPDSFALSSTLPSCGHICDLHAGIQIHVYIIKAGFLLYQFVHNSLLDMYCKCSLTSIARKVFDELETKDLVSWNVLLTGLSRNGNSNEAIILFDQMRLEGIEMDKVTFLSAIQACSNLGSLERGRFLHQRLVISGIKDNNSLMITSSLIDMYGKCGDIEMARSVFDHNLEKNVISWTSIISGYGRHGRSKEAIRLFSQMVESGVRPNKTTFSSILSACSHAGRVEEGLCFYNLMREYGIEPEITHYVCVVDLLSRFGYVDQAFDFIRLMPVQPTVEILRALFQGCHVHPERRDGSRS